MDHSFESLAALRVAASELQQVTFVLCFHIIHNDLALFHNITTRPFSFQVDAKASSDAFDSKVADFSAAVACSILSIGVFVCLCVYVYVYMYINE